MVEAALCMLFTFGLALFGVGFGVVGLVRGRISLTQSRPLRGRPARVAAVACILASLAFWWWLVRMWSLYDR